MNRQDLKSIILDAIGKPGDSLSIPKIARYIWENYEPQLKGSGEFFYTWQYDMRWAGDSLVRDGKLDKTAHRGMWMRLK
ncbi:MULTISPECIES: hypothetical protein [unclassified Bradyrhizobium]|uniref:hypothetical protein n=1 Tax=unclassified Bradyrhizobium TaxID=2631580 RepID=UPI001BA9991D|nr:MULTISPECIES: hypothetical protein [unclassified Bradyrhizobium]MBR1304197.1 hypothetical protein [Bradyrhizobium sp. U87765 SZCCT0110]MBR1348128.1 hypothetical protein [Bradyrhizobium sp. U87765 SZCCT0048]